MGGPDSEELAEETAREPVWERPERGLLRVHFFAGWLLERCLSARMLRQKQPPSFSYLAPSIRGIFIKCLLCIRHQAAIEFHLPLSVRVSLSAYYVPVRC